MLQSDFLRHGWGRFPFDPELDAWARDIREFGIALVQDPELRCAWLRHGGTWFAGVNVLPNSNSGALGQSGELRGQAVEFIRALYPEYHLKWDQGQISVCYPGYPMPDTGETDTAFAFRAKRDATHMDGMLAVGAERRRYWREFHGFILGVPLTKADAKAAPLVVWDKSHEIMRLALENAFADHTVETWSQTDLTEIYQAARRKVFETCKRIELPLRLGEATLLHRFTLHGVAPWEEGAEAEENGRMIAYFRPSFPWSASDSLAAQ